MGYRLTATNGKAQYNQDEWVCDTVADLQKIPAERSNMGSIALIIETSQVFMLTSKGEWKEI